MRKHFLLAIAAVALSSSSALAEAVYNDASATVTHDCAKDASVAINSSQGTFTLTGECSSVTLNGAMTTLNATSIKKLAVTGSTNQVDVESASKIVVTGTSNVVTYKSGIGKAKKPKVSATGIGNKISKRK